LKPVVLFRSNPMFASQSIAGSHESSRFQMGPESAPN
jgi:hypothetical protein